MWREVERKENAQSMSVSTECKGDGDILKSRLAAFAQTG